MSRARTDGRMRSVRVAEQRRTYFEYLVVQRDQGEERQKPQDEESGPIRVIRVGRVRPQRRDTQPRSRFFCPRVVRLRVNYFRFEEFRTVEGQTEG